MLEVKNVSLDDIRSYANNPRKISDEAIDAVAESIKTFGFKVPVILDSDNVIVAGHTRVQAAQKLGLSEVPCVVADDLTPEQIKAFRLADNKTGELSGWDFEKLDLELEELTALNIDMSDFGFELDNSESYIDEISKGFDGSEKNTDSDCFNITFTIDKGHKDKFDEYIKANGKDALKNLLIDEVSEIA